MTQQEWEMVPDLTPSKPDVSPADLIRAEQQAYFEKKDQVRDLNYTDRMIRKFLRLCGVQTISPLAFPGTGKDDKLDAVWFDHHFPDCPFRLAVMNTWKTIPIQDFFWRPTHSDIWNIYEEACDNYGGIVDVYDPQVHRVALIYNDRKNKKDIVLREHHDGHATLPRGYPRCMRMVRDRLMVMEPLEGFAETLLLTWQPAIG